MTKISLLRRLGAMLTILVFAVLASTVALLVLPSALAAQEQAEPGSDSPFRIEMVAGPTLMGDQGYLGAPVGMFASISWVGFLQTKGYRLGMVQTSTSHSGAGATTPASAERGVLYNRYAAAFTLERIGIRVRGRRVITTGYGFGAGSLGYDVKQLPSPDGQSIRRVDGWAPAVTASADVAYRFPRGRASFIPLPTDVDFFIGVRSVAMLGVVTVTATPPSSGPIPTTRGIGHINQIGIGLRFGLFMTDASDEVVGLFYDASRSDFRCGSGAGQNLKLTPTLKPLRAW